MADVPMPRLSDSMTEGTIVRWLHPAGASVERGTELVEIETDKATVTCEADDSGTLEILAAEGATLPIGAPIARLSSAADAASEPAIEPGTAAPAEARPTPSVPGGETTAPGSGTPDSGVPAPSSVTGTPGAGPRTIASPLARRLARERGVDLATVTGTGPGGRIVRADIEAASPPSPETPTAPKPQAGSKTAPATTPPDPRPGSEHAPGPAAASHDPQAGSGQDAGPGIRGAVRIVQPEPAERVVIRRMTESAGIPQFSLSTDLDMEACARLRTEITDSGADPVPTYNDFIVKASALALREFPYLNAGYVDGVYELYDRVNVGVAVDRDGDLIVPTVFDADRRTLTDIARTTRTLAERVRTGAVTPAELDGGTFAISNLGMYGVTEFSALIQPPQAAILAVGELRTEAAFVDDSVVPRRTLRATVSCDHRIVYGARAAKFLARVRDLLERPIALLTNP